MVIGGSKENACLNEEGSSLLVWPEGGESPVKYYHIRNQGLAYYTHPVKQESLPVPVKKQLENFFEKEYYWDSNFIDKVRSGTLDFYAHDFTFKDKSFYILAGPSYLGGSGGMPLYLYLKEGEKYKLIFYGFGGFRLSGSETNGFPDLVISHHISAGSGCESIYKWKDGEYLLFRKNMRYANLFTDEEVYSVERIYDLLHQNLKERWKVEEILKWLTHPIIDQKAEYRGALRAYFENNPEGDITLIDDFVRDNKKSFVWDLLEAAQAYEKTGNKDKAINLCALALKIADNDRQIQKIKEEVKKLK